MKLKNRVIIIFFLLALVPLLIMGGGSYYRMSISLEQNKNESLRQLNDQVKNNLEMFLTDLARVSLSPLYDSKVLSALERQQQSDYYAGSISDYQDISIFLSSLIFNRPDVRGIHIVNDHGYIFSHLDRTEIKVSINIEDMKWYTEAKEADGAWVLVHAHQPGYYINTPDGTYFGVARLLKNPKTNQSLGVIIIDVDVNFFEKLLSRIENAEVVIFDERGQKIYGQTSFTWQGLEQAVKEAQWMQFADKEYLVTERISNEYGFVLYSFIPRDSVYEQVDSLGEFTTILTLITACIAFLLASIASRNLVRPVEKLKQSMLRVSAGNLEERIELDRKDEFGTLARGFNAMIEQITQLIDEVYKKELLEREAEYRSLQNQINPHFIYNTLESINMNAIEHNNFELSRMVTKLAKIMRSATKHRSEIRLAEEIDRVRAYVDIMKMRLEDRLKVEWDIPYTLMDAIIPGFAIQPLIENAIQHGISPLEEGGLISISASMIDDHYMQICVADNGIGMSNRDLMELKLLLSSPNPPTDEKGLALWNIQQRIALKYNMESALSIHSEKNKGTTVTLTLPLKRTIEQ